MTSYYPFTPSNVQAPSFQATLDGNVYNLMVTWNLFGQRYYLSCFDQSGNRIFTVPVITSPETSLLSSLSWDAATLMVTATCVAPHGLTIGSVVNLTIAGCTPSGYDGAYQVNVVDPYSFTYSAASDPGAIQMVGTYGFIISMSAGYFSSTIVFRNDQFEVSP